MQRGLVDGAERLKLLERDTVTHAVTRKAFAAARKPTTATNAARKAFIAAFAARKALDVARKARTKGALWTKEM